MAKKQTLPKVMTGARAESTDFEPTGLSPKAFKARIDRCIRRKENDLIPQWRANVEYRLAKIAESDSDDDRSPLPIDWTQTKVKAAQLFSALPRLIVTGEGPYKPAGPVFGARLYDRMKEGGAKAAMTEVIVDVINASGIGGVLVSYEARTETQDFPIVPLEMLPPEQQMQIAAGVMTLPTEKRPVVVDRRFSLNRVAPEDLLWDTSFEKSDFNQSPWVGHTGRMSWPEAKAKFKLSDDVREKVVGPDKTNWQRLNNDADQDKSSDEGVVRYHEIFYWRYRYDASEKYFKAIGHMVFVEGLGSKPVVNNKQWNGQRFDQEIGRYIGSCRFPLQFLTLNYVSGKDVPPSDSAIIRPLVRELIKSRFQMIMQRDYSKPVRWHDVNRIDADIQTLLMLGDWQGSIPVQGSGDKALGEIARSNYPREDFEFDRIIKNDLNEAASVGPNQMGMMASGERSAAEAKITQGNFSTRIAQERGRCVDFYLSLADVMAGLMALYDDFELPDPADGQRLAMWDRTRINHELAFDILGDSSVAVDTEQRVGQLLRYLNIVGKSGEVKLSEILPEITALHMLDPGKVLQPPPPKPPEPVSASIRFTGSKDLRDPVALAMLLQSGQGPTPEALEAAFKLIERAGAMATVTLGSDGDEVEVITGVGGTPPAPAMPPSPVPGGLPPRTPVAG